MNIKKKVAGVAAALVVLGSAGAAYAWYSSTGSGTGTATVGSSSAMQLTSDPATGLFPGGADVIVPVRVHNPGGGYQRVMTVSGSVATQGDCLGSWFQVDPYLSGANVAPGADAPVTPNVHVRMLNVGASQDACQGLAMVINWTSD